MHLYRNFIKTLQKILVRILIALICIQVTGYIALQFPATQTLIIKEIVKAASGKINGKIDIERVYFVFFNKIVLQNFSITSQENTPLLDSLKRNFNQSDTLISCEKLSVSLKSTDLMKLKVSLNRINIENGVFNLQNEGAQGRSNLGRIFKIDPNREKDTTKKGIPFNLLANSLRIKNFRFNLNNPDKAIFKGDSIINFSNLSVGNINVNINNVKVENDTIFGNISHISATDRSGFTIEKLSGNLEVSSTESRINNLYISDRFTRVNANFFSMKYNSSRDFSDFVNKVVLDCDFIDSYFSFKTIGRITPSLDKSNLGLFISGRVTGPIRDLRSESIQARSKSGQTDIDVGVRMSGLPEVDETMTFIRIKKARTTSNDIARVISGITGSPEIQFFKNLAPNIVYHFSGDLTGLPDDFVAHGVVRSKVGEVDVDLLLRNDKQLDGFLIKGGIVSKKFNVGKVISNKSLGEVSMNGSITALTNKRNGITVTIDSVNVNQLHFNGYDYTNIFAWGEYNRKHFDGRIVCHDPNLYFRFQGLFSLNGVNDSRYNFHADIPHANLAALNLDTRDSISVVSLQTIANFNTTSEKDIVGNINILNASVTNSSGTNNIGPVKLTSLSAENHYNITLDAPFIDAEFNGTAPVSSFIKKVTALTLYKHAGDFINKKSTEKSSKQELEHILNDGNEYSITANTGNSRALCDFIMPGLFIQENTRLNTTISKENIFDLSLQSGRIAVNTKNYFKGLDLELSNRDSLLRVNLTSDNILAAGVRMDTSRISIVGIDNILDASFKFKNTSAEENNASLNTRFEFLEDSLKINIKDSSFVSLKGNRWNFTPSGVYLLDSAIVIDDFKISNNEQYFSANGLLSKQKRDSLRIGLNNFDIKVLNLFLNKPFNIEGHFSGDANISTFGDHSNIFLDLTGDSVYVFNNPVGVMKVMSKWYQPENRFNILINSKLEGRTTLTVSGYFKPEGKYLNLNGSLDNLSVSYFEPFLSDIISKSSGTFSGNVNLSGPLDQLELKGEDCRFNDFLFTVNYTQVPYRLNGPVTLNEKGIFADDLTVTDRFGNKGQVHGGLTYHYFRDIGLDTRIDFMNLECLNTDETDNDYFYGEAYATGSFGVRGTFSNIVLDINVVPNEKTALHIPMSSASTASQSNLLTFKQPESNVYYDAYDSLLFNKVKTKTASQMQVLMKANINPNADMFIEFNKSLGDVIKANGSGPVSLDINPSVGVFDIFGDYVINQGSYKFVLPGFGFAAKDFIIQPGGTIHFNGDIYNTTLNLTATYRTKVAINTLIADTSSVSTRRNVNCEIIMSGNLMNPELKFNIDIPDLDPTTKVRVESALNTEGKIQKQFAALIISGGFLPDEQSGITNNSTILYSNVSEMLSNQINTIFQQLGIPLDLGFNYQPGEKGTDIFDVAVSTQLFNNRVLINGSIGNDPYQNSGSNRGVIGNVDVELKLDKSGRLRMNLFSHAADQYSNYLDDSQRSGIGISFQQEFNRFKDIFKRKSKEQREYEKRQKEIARLERKQARLEKRGLPDSAQE